MLPIATAEKINPDAAANPNRFGAPRSDFFERRMGSYARARGPKTAAGTALTATAPENATATAATPAVPMVA